MANNGDSNFIVDLLDAESGDSEELLANEIGSWEGLIPIYTPAQQYVLDIDSDGDWEIIVRQPRFTSADVTPTPVTGSDEYPNYLGPIRFDGLTRVHGRYQGDSNFIVELLNHEGQYVDLIFNEIGEFEGETTVSASGIGLIRVKATGAWEITAGEG